MTPEIWGPSKLLEITQTQVAEFRQVFVFRKKNHRSTIYVHYFCKFFIHISEINADRNKDLKIKFTIKKFINRIFFYIQFL